MVDECPNRNSNSDHEIKITGHIVLAILFSLNAAFQIAKIAIGGQYMGDCDVVLMTRSRDGRETSHMDVPTYLVINGAVTLGIDLLTMFCMRFEHGFMVMVVGNIVSRIIFLVYGSCLVIGYYGSWTYEKGNDGTYYCAFTPSMFAYIHLVVSWILITLFCCIPICFVSKHISDVDLCCWLNCLKWCCAGTKEYFQGPPRRTPTNLDI